MKSTPTQNTWTAMKQRCQNPNAPDYLRYGGRGIRVCEAWQTLAGFMADMGVRPEGRTLDRRDPDGNYEPANCRWATPTEQQRNRRCTVLDAHKVSRIRQLCSHGITQREVAASFGVARTTVSAIVTGRQWA